MDSAEIIPIECAPEQLAQLLVNHGVEIDYFYTDELRNLPTKPTIVVLDSADVEGRDVVRRHWPKALLPPPSPDKCTRVWMIAITQDEFEWFLTGHGAERNPPATYRLVFLTLGRAFVLRRPVPNDKRAAPVREELRYRLVAGEAVREKLFTPGDMRFFIAWHKDGDLVSKLSAMSTKERSRMASLYRKLGWGRA